VAVAKGALVGFAEVVEALVGFSAVDDAPPRSQALPRRAQPTMRTCTGDFMRSS
jgi:hypothetical protein